MYFECTITTMTCSTSITTIAAITMMLLEGTCWSFYRLARGTLILYLAQSIGGPPWAFVESADFVVDHASSGTKGIGNTHFGRV